MKNFYLLLICILATTCFSAAAEQRPALSYFPDIEGCKTLVCDFHMHTVFSDGAVWPTVRVEEAWREGLDAIAITDHIEYQRYKEDVAVKLERSYELALPKANELDILLIKGAEITKDTPPGHYNAIFLKEVSPLQADDVLDCVKAACEQKAFVFWNHHAWKGVEKGQWEDVQTKMYENNWLHGMEVANTNTYYPLAHQWCLDRNLTMIGSSDIHPPSIDYIYIPQKHRTLTLVFAKDRSIEAIHEALFARRTAAWKGNMLIGRQPHLQALFDASVSAKQYSRGTKIILQIANNAFIDLELKRTGKIGPVDLQIPARSTILLQVEKPVEESQFLSYEVRNMLIAPEKGLQVNFEVILPQDSDRKLLQLQGDKL